MSTDTGGREVVEALERLSDEALEAAFRACCASDAWVAAMTAGRPYGADTDLAAGAEDAWWGLTETEWLQAFEAHPRIGDRTPVDHWTREEQAGLDEAAPEALAELEEGNREYEDTFGHRFLIYAIGLGVEQVLGALRRRLGNAADVELQVAAAEQARIIQTRLARLSRESAPGAVEDGSEPNTLSTSVMDTAIGQPAAGIAVELARAAAGAWKAVASGTTDDEGHLTIIEVDDGGGGLAPGEYRLRFASGAYFRERSQEPFHPCVDVVFRVATADGHLHVPLLLGPFGYTTYRGS